MSPRKTPAQTGDSGQAEHVLDENSRARAFWGPRRGAPRRYKCPTHMRIPCNPVGLAPVGIYGLYNDAAPFIATRHATSRQTPESPYQDHDSKPRQLVEMGFPGCLVSTAVILIIYRPIRLKSRLIGVRLRAARALRAPHSPPAALLRFAGHSSRNRQERSVS